MIAKTEAAIRDGGYFAIGMPSRLWQTTITIRSAIWAIVYGHCRYVYLVAADAGKAKNMLKSIKTRSSSTVVVSGPPARLLPRAMPPGAPQRPKAARSREPTNLDWTADVAQFATVAGSECSGSRIGVGGVTGPRCAGDAPERRGAAARADPDRRLSDERARRQSRKPRHAWLPSPPTSAACGPVANSPS